MESKTPANETLSPGSSFGEFKVMRCLGVGLYGGLYTMQQIGTGDLFSVLILPALVGNDKKFPQRFVEGGERLLGLKHPHILELKRFDIINNRFCLIMEPVDGLSLLTHLQDRWHQILNEERLRRQTRQPFTSPKADPNKDKQEKGKDSKNSAHQDAAPMETPPDAPPTPENELHPETKTRVAGLASNQVMEYAMMAAKAIQAAHEAGVHHYNLTTSNMIAQTDGTLKIWGFGLYEMVGEELFKRLVSAGVPPLRTGTASVLTLNPLEGLSPEIQKGTTPDGRSDVYCLGASLYMCFTGKSIHSGAELPSRIIANFPEVWDAILVRCLEPEIDKRYVSCSRLVADIENLSAKPKEEAARMGLRLGDKIDRIPLPKPLASRLSSPRQRIARLIFLGIFAVAVVAAASFSYRQIFVTEESSTEIIVIRSKPGQTPNLQFNISPTTARISFSGRGGGQFLTKDGRLNVNLPKGRYMVRVEASGHAEESRDLRFHGDAQTLEFQLEAQFANLEIRALPGAQVFSVTPNGPATFIGEIPKEGRLTVQNQLFAGVYSFKVELAGHAPAAFPNVNLASPKPVVLEAKLQPLPASITVKTDPPGMSVSLGGQDQGTTPLTLDNQPLGQPLEVVVQHPAYRSRSRTVTLQPGQTETIDFGTLEKKTGDLLMNILLGGTLLPDDMKEQLSVKIDGQTTTFRGGKLAEVTAGPHVLEIEHPEIQPYRLSFAIEDAKPTTVLPNLALRKGSVTVILDPLMPYQLLADGQIVTGQNNRFTVDPRRAVALEIQIRDCLPIRQSVQLAPAENIVWKVEPQRIPAPVTGQDYRVPYLEINLIFLTSGQFELGSPPPEETRLPNEGDGNGRQTRVSLTRGFWMGQTEVTQAQWTRLMGANPSQYQNPAKPVESITWEEAMAYAQKLTETESKAQRLPAGYAYRLPTQAEWEYACRAGTTTPFSFGAEADSSRGNFRGLYPRQFSTVEVARHQEVGTVPVASFAANPWNLYDMHGNVREWCYEAFSERYPGGQVSDWVGPLTGTYRVSRGGGWEDSAPRCRSAARDRIAAQSKSASQGFRICLAPALPEASANP